MIESYSRNHDVECPRLRLLQDLIQNGRLCADTQVSKEKFLDIVLRRVKARDDDSDDDDESDDDNMRDDTEQAKREIIGIRNEGEKIFDRIWESNDKLN